MNKLNYLVRVAMIGAIYVILNIIFAPISYGPVQVRIAEALVVLPFIDPSAIIGLFIGCILANVYGGLGMVDIIGGKDFKESKFNRATQAYRQSGSAFKPFIYLTALDNEFTPSNIIEDSPVTFENGWSPENYEKEFRGPVTLREAFELSINVVGVKL
ncbi:unnamed protein product, partial [marine sediment metagenome]